MKKLTQKIYHITNWSAYNRALFNRGNIAIWFDPKTQWYAEPQGKQGRNKTEPYRVCRRLNILRDYSDEKTKLYPRN